MAVSGGVIPQDGANARLHPYLVALVRWCMSCVWSTATVLLHRLMTTPLQPIAGPRPLKPRPAGKEHLDPEPRVECVVLHHPHTHALDVIFVHGLYGSLRNTWRQGEWSSKYVNGPEKIHLRRPTSPPILNTCHKCAETDTNTNISYNENDFNDTSKETNDFNDYENLDNDFSNIDKEFFEDIKKILPTEQVFITEQFYNNTLLDQVEIVDNYEAQAKFVSDLFKNNCDMHCDSENVNNDDQNDCNDSGNMFNDGNRCNDSENMFNDETMYNDNENRKNDTKTIINDKEYECKCNENGSIEVDIKEFDCKCRVNETKECEVGCGCICDECYSHCWPKDWIKVDYPDARVISINYTSDPYLWRPLWVKESKRLRLHERAEQMTQQLLDLGVGRRPVIWVGHSKGGLFIKQIYCEAYEAYLKTRNKEQTEEQNMTEYRKDNEINNFNDNFIQSCNNDGRNVINDDDSGNNDVENKEFDGDPTELIVEGNVLKNARTEGTLSLNSDEDKYDAFSRASLWTNSAGFMFYSVPHRGSPLADIKTPLTARSVELIEITKDCPLVLSLQERWARAARPARPAVRSLVETRRTLMSVLWLRIVSADSADPGIGALCGVSVDHREICKPASRRCLLYTELSALIRAALNKCTCQ